MSVWSSNHQYWCGENAQIWCEKVGQLMFFNQPLGYRCEDTLLMTFRLSFIMLLQFRIKVPVWVLDVWNHTTFSFLMAWRGLPQCIYALPSSIPYLLFWDTSTAKLRKTIWIQIDSNFPQICRIARIAAFDFFKTSWKRHMLPGPYCCWYFTFIHILYNTCMLGCGGEGCLSCIETIFTSFKECISAITYLKLCTF